MNRENERRRKRFNRQERKNRVGLIARHKDGVEYEIQKDGSWRKVKGEKK